MKNNATRLIAAGTLGTLALGLAGCGGSSTGQEGETAEVTAIVAPVNYEQAYIAEQEGYFEDRGLDVEIKPGGTPQDNIAQVMGGSADLTIGSWDTIVSSTAQGVPIKVVASSGVVSSTVDTSGLIVMADSDIQSAEDLQGRTVAFNDLGGGPHLVAMQAAEEAGVSRDGFESVRLPFASMEASLTEGHVDAVFPSDSFYEQMADDPAYRVIANPTREFRAGLPITVWTATDAWLEQNPETATKFIEALDEANEFYADPANLDEVLAIRQEVSGVSEEQARQMRSEFSTTIPLGVTQSVTDVLVDYGIVENPEGVKPAREMIWEHSPTSD